MKVSSFLSYWKKYLPIISLIIIVGLFLRAYNLTHLPVFGDEAIYIRWAQVMRSVPSLRFLPMTDGKQPLFMWSVIPFLKVISDPLVAGRMVSAITGMGTGLGVSALTYLLTKSEKSSIFAGLIYYISPLALFFDRLALSDSMLSLFVIWTVVFYWIAASTKRLDAAMLSGFSLGGAMLTKSSALFIAIMLPLVPIALLLEKKFKRYKFLQSLLLLLPVYVISYGLYNILRLGENFHMLTKRTLDYVYPYSHIFSSPLDPLKPHLGQVFEYFLLLGPVLILLWVLYGLYFVSTDKKKWSKTLVLLFGIVPILIVSEYTKVMTARYIIFAFPFIVVFASFAIDRVSFKKLGISQIVMALLIIHSFYIDYLLLTNVQAAPLPRSERSGYLEKWTSGYGIKEASDYILNEYLLHPDEKIVVGTEGYFGTLPDGLQIYLNNYPEITIIGVGIDLKEVPAPLVESKKSGNKTYLLINDTRLIFDYQSEGISLIHEYPKAASDGVREKLLLLQI